MRNQPQRCAVHGAVEHAPLFGVQCGPLSLAELLLERLESRCKLLLASSDKKMRQQSDINQNETAQSGALANSVIYRIAAFGRVTCSHALVFKTCKN